MSISFVYRQPVARRQRPPLRLHRLLQPLQPLRRALLLPLRQGRRPRRDPAPRPGRVLHRGRDPNGHVHSDGNGDSDRHVHAYRNSYRDRNSHGDGNSYSNGHGKRTAEAYAHATASAYTAASALALFRN